MNDETPINRENAAMRRKRRLPEPVERVGFALQERLVWPLQDRFGHLGSGPSRDVLLGGGAAAFLAGVAVVFALSSGGGSSVPAKTTVVEAAAPREPLATTPAPAEPEPAKQEPPRETLHGAAPVFSPPSPASKGGEKTGGSKTSAADATASESADSGAANDSGGAAADEAGSGDPAAADSASTSATPAPADARISSDPSKTPKTDSGASANAATAARAAVPDGPPAGPAALKVAREFAAGFVVYETGGKESAFKGAFAASATPKLTKALLQRPPKQPAGVRVPRAKVLNVVAGPSQGRVYKVSVSLLRVGVTSELRLDMERIGSGKRAEWRVTNVLG
ncbi:MAG: hypothetical protein AB7V58_17575 [Solirubrobacterales bacterium]